MPTIWTDIATRAGITLTDQQRALLSRYLDLLLQANEKFNLTRIIDRASAEVQHVADALMLLPHLPREPHRLADVGSGGGVPGIPLAITRPDVEVTLIESTQKKAAFLRECSAALNLPNVRVIADRAETIARGKDRESFDVVVARAVAAMEQLVEWCLPLAKKGGRFLAMKGAKIAEELPPATRIIQRLNGGHPVIHPAGLPGAEGHVIVEIAKTGKTDPRYPAHGSEGGKR